MKKLKQSYLNDDKRVKRAARNLAKYLGDLHQNMTEFMIKNKPVRRRILADVKALVDSVPKSDRDLVAQAIAIETQRVFTAQPVLAAKRSPKVGVSSGCVGRPGGGVTVSDGGATVKGCVIGTPGSGLQGGGVEVSVSC